MKNPLHIFGFGVIVWIVPFVVGMLFYTPEGKLVTDVFLFKTVMLLAGNTTGCYLLIRYFRNIENDFTKHALIIGTAWLLVNLFLDFIILIPLSKLSVGDYFVQIGLRYLLMPVIAYTVGSVAEQAAKNNRSLE